jgi:hypothetical protein
MANIFKTMQINLFFKPRIVENILIGEDSSLNEIQMYASLFKKFHDVFSHYYN